MSTAAPPSLPAVRKNSPLSIALSPSQDDSTPTLASTSSVPSSSRPVGTRSPMLPPPAPQHRLSASSASSSAHQGMLPIAPSPDSLLFRSTISQLDASTTTLKRLSKAVLAQAAVYTNLLDSVARAEDELFQNMGELGVWLEVGYGLPSGLWDGDTGVRRLRKGKWRAAKEEVEVLVEGVTKAVRGDLKRQGLAAGGAQERYERLSKQYYSQTASYLSQHPTDPSSSGATTPSKPSQADAAQAARSAHFDLARYSHHSTLLYALPPSSVTCLDMLVKWYTWIGGLVGDSPPAPDPNGERALSPNQTVHPGNGPVMTSVKSSLASSLSQLGDIRAELLEAWAERNTQTGLLEEEAQRLQDEVDGPGTYNGPVGHLANGGGGISSPPSALGIEHKRIGHAKRMHRVQRSMGGKLWDMISHSGTSPNLSSMANGQSDKVPSANLQVLDAPIGLGRPRPQPKRSSTSEGTVRPPAIDTTGKVLENDDELLSPLEMLSSGPQIPASNGVGEQKHIPLGTPVMGVGGISGAGDEDERHEAVGRKKEGVLWGMGAWDELGKSAAKAKWEKFWVVLDRSKIYEYRDHEFEKPEAAHATIDLKFASVREGRGTDRRFVFEIVTPTKGRRLYQATSESEMKQWLYAICNAIESSINGTSSIRTFDPSKLRTPSGSLDDHALPAKTSKLFPGLSARSPSPSLLQAPHIPSIPSTPGNRRSMPPLSDADAKRLRKTSIKKLVRQGAEFASGVLGGNPRGSLEVPRGAFLAPNDGRGLGMKSRVNSGGSSGWSSADDGGRFSPSPSGLRSSVVSLPEDSEEGVGAEAGDTSWSSGEGLVDADGEIEKRVLQMAGLSVSASASASPARRIQSESVGKQGGLKVTSEMARSRSHDPSTAHAAHGDAGRAGDGPLDMTTLRAIAELPGNTLCADCGKSMKSSRWATLSLRGEPMVMFLCIRCVGHHRGLGTHISKPRSVDLDIWTPESIASAKEWGNIRGNQVWEAQKPVGMPPPNDDDIGEYIKSKYVEGKWLSEDNRARFKLPPTNIGQAI